MGCDKCGLDDPDCQCWLSELDERVIRLEEELDKLTDVVKAISDCIKGNIARGRIT